MKIFNYHNSEYFNETDYFLIKTNLGGYFVTQCHWYNGSWFSNDSLKYKMTSVLTVSCGQIKNKEVRYINTDVKGTISKFVQPDGIGVVWKQGSKPLPHFWNKFENLEL